MNGNSYAFERRIQTELVPILGKFTIRLDLVTFRGGYAARLAITRRLFGPVSFDIFRTEAKCMQQKVGHRDSMIAELQKELASPVYDADTAHTN